jgi:hypothetical protein
VFRIVKIREFERHVLRLMPGLPTEAASNCGGGLPKEPYGAKTRAAAMRGRAFSHHRTVEKKT